MSPEENEDIEAQMGYLSLGPDKRHLDEVLGSPLLTVPVVQSTPPPQFGLFGVNRSGDAPPRAARLFYNVTCPSSVFICGSQGSGKSNTLACLLENCLIPSRLGKLPAPLTGVVFHYDSFVSDSGGLPCEAAFLASSEDVSVRVLCAPTNIRTVQKMYGRIPEVKVEPLILSDRDLNTRRMLDLMAVGEGGMPLYLHVVTRILRDMRIEQQSTGSGFSYATFKKRLDLADLTAAQRGPLSQRLDTLESFMAKGVKGDAAAGKPTVDWQAKSSQLTIVDLSCPCVTAEMACSLFNICLSLFLEQESAIGRVVAVDEAHKYMKESSESQALTGALLETIRLQRHLGVRVIVSTQEPTVSTKLLDLCSVTVVHRFTSPDWLRTLRSHLAGVSSMSVTASGREETEDVGSVAMGGKDPVLELFAMIVGLRTGEALVFAPSAVIGLGEGRAGGPVEVQRLAHRSLRVQVRSRLTRDGGQTIMA
ncbi:hypothetical protein CTA1_5915 [Colletotrichum tanaceti]|uniref:Zona occludens toxin N-terminal domain-containing protein n=1 Tax=Colletotrichum tanaceti TaxID=1306861 RepID=A0A4U6XDS6_9PEZI|nr:hypothetical protein CTA1_5915 [Colletotrichum tanaceti]